MSAEAPRSNFESFRFVWSMLTQAQRRELAWLHGIAVIMSMCTLVGIAAIVPFFTVLADPAAIERHAVLATLYRALGFTQHGTFVIFLGGAFLASVLLANAINLFGAYAINRFAYRIGRDFHVSLFEEYLHRDYLFHVRTGSVTLLNNVVYEATRVATGFVQGGVSLLANVLTCILIVASVMWLNPALALAAAVLFSGSYAAIYFLLRGRLARHGQREGESWDGLLRTLTESFGGIRDIHLRGSQSHHRDVMAADCDALADLGLGMFAMAHSPRYVLECVMVAALIGAALWLGGGDSAQWLAQLSFLGLASYRLLPAMQQIFATLAKIRSDRQSLLRIAADLRSARNTRRAPPLTEEELARWRGRPFGSIDVRDVSFRYAAQEPLAIRAASLRIPAGAVVGFVGHNGSGKTTLADIVLGLLQPESGTIEVDGIALDHMNLRAWRSNVAHVPQQVFLTDASLRENIAPGVPAREVDVARLHASLAAAQLDDLVASLPEGVEHRLGERGRRVSGGQQQRIGIARALYARAAVLVLDEATSSLDGRAERGIVATLAALRGRVTTIVIAHRITAMRSCDLIYEFEAGSIVGSGAFDTLNRDSSRFRALTGTGP